MLQSRKGNCCETVVETKDESSIVVVVEAFKFCGGHPFVRDCQVTLLDSLTIRVSLR
jgi:hypothetical protein